MFENNMHDSGASPTVFVVDENRSSRRDYAGILEKQGWSVEMHGRAEEFLAANKGTPPQGCLLLEAELPGTSGLELQRYMRQHEWPLPVVFLSRSGTIATAVQAMRSGAVTFLETPVEAEELVRWIRLALAVGARLREQILQRDLLRSRLDLLSAREREVLQYVMAGKSSREIGETLFISDKTVQLHRARIMKKTGAVNVAALASMVHTAEGTSVVAATRAILEQLLTQM